MRLALLALQRQLEFSWEEIDIDGDTALIFKYDMLVPVLEFRGKEVCHYFIDQDAIRDIVCSD
jgi:thioredoxin reductase (NADPH)